MLQCVVKYIHMNHRLAQRIYTQRALNMWLRHLDYPWEHHFTQDKLALGRTFYKQNIIRRIELTITEATIEARHQEHDFYCIITREIPKNKFEKPSFTIRSSTNDKLLSDALAVAGLYELEEMISTLSNPLYDEKADEKKIEHTSIEIKKNELPLVPQKQKTKPNDSSTLPKHTLKLYLKATRQGLVIEPFWIINEPTTKEINVFSKQAETVLKLNAYDRQTVIHLLSQCSKAGFQFLKTQNIFLLPDLGHLVEFLSKTLSSWKKYYTIQLDNDLQKIAKQGPREPKLWLKAGFVNLQHAGTPGQISIQLGFELEGTPLSESETKYLLKHSQDLILIPGKGLIRVSQQKRQQLNDLQESLHYHPTLSPYRLLSLFWDKPNFLEVDPALQSWHQKLLNPPTPLSLELPHFLREYQQAGITWLWHLCNCECHGLLADEMGLGKTLQILTLLNLRRVNQHPISLIVCPASVIGVWQKETEKFFPHIKTLILRRRVDLPQLFNQHSQSDQPLLLLASYSQLRRHKSDLEKHTFAYAILDEAQFIKNPESKVAQAACALQARHRYALTGTPIENRLTDIWTIFRFLMPGLLGTRKRFEEHVKSDPVTTLEKLRKQLTPFILRRTKQNVLPDLPPKTIIPWTCTLTQHQIHLYQNITEEMRSQFQGHWDGQTQKSSLQLLTALLRLRQTCIAPSLITKESDSKLIIEHSCKIQALLELLEDPLASGHKVVVFSQFTQLLSQLESPLKLHYPGTKRFKLTGQTQNRSLVVDNFQNHSGPAIMLASLKAAGTGITLHSADYVFLMDPWWNPAVEEQAIDRVHRLGKSDPVFVYRLIAQGTIEERVESLKAFKRSLSTTLIEELPNVAQLKHYFKSLHELIDYIPKQ